jgi:glycerol-3-phosphate dehydrogenase
MDDAINLTIALGGYFYIGQLAQWREYARALTAGKITAYRQSAAFRNQSLTAFFRLFRSLWNTKKISLPTPEEYGLIALRPENLTQDEIIEEFLRA